MCLYRFRWIEVNFMDVRGWRFGSLWWPVATCGPGVLGPEQKIWSVTECMLEAWVLEAYRLKLGDLVQIGVGARWEVLEGLVITRCSHTLEAQRGWRTSHDGD